MVRFETPLSVYEVVESLRRIEITQGRTPDAQKFTARQLDLDLLLYGEAIIHEPSLILPRPDIAKYRFVLQPLADIAPDEKHPLTQQTFRDMLEQFMCNAQL